jgi:DNA-binding SARP family transcriptional activator/TolB-like protein
VIAPSRAPELLLRTFGGLSLERSVEVLSGAAAQRSRLAILACIAATGERGLSRDSLLAMFWPESDTRRARGALRQALYSLRQATGADLTTGTAQLRIDRTVLDSDVALFRDAVREGREEDAVKLYRGSWLEGVHISGCSELDRWIDGRRERLAADYRTCLETLAVRARDSGDRKAAVAWCRRLALHNPLSGAVVAQLVEALEAAGDAAGALQAAEAHERQLAEEYELRPGAEVAGAVARIMAAQRGTPAAADHGASADAVERTATRVRFANVHRDGGDARRAADVSAASASARPPPSSRAAWRRLVFAAIAIVAALAGARIVERSQAPPLSSQRVAVAPFENLTGDPAYDPIGYVAADWIAQGIVETGLVDVVSPVDALVSTRWLSREHEVKPGGRLAAAFATENGARILISGAYFRQGQDIVLQARIVDVESGNLLRSAGEVSTTLESVREAAELLRQHVLGALGTLVDERLTSSTSGTRMPPSYEAYAQFAEGMDLFVQASRESYARTGQGRRRYDDAAARFEQAARLDSNYTMPVLWTAFAWRNAGDRTRELSAVEQIETLYPRLSPTERAMADYIILAADAGAEPGAEMNAEKLEEQYRAAKRVASLAPDSEWLWKYARAARNTGRLREAVTALERMNPDRRWIEQWPGYWTELTETLHFLGECERELETQTRFSRLMEIPGWNGPGYRVRALACLRRESEARALMDSFPDVAFRFEELDAHGLVSLADSFGRARIEKHDVGSAVPAYYLAGALIRAGMHREARDASLSGLDSAGPGMRPSLLGMLGTAKAMLGDHEGARAILRELSSIRPQPDSDPFGNAPIAEAQVAAALGDHEYAVTVVLEKLAAGRHSLFYGSPMHGGRAYWYDFHYTFGSPGWERLKQDPRIRPLLQSRD